MVGCSEGGQCDVGFGTGPVRPDPCAVNLFHPNLLVPGTVPELTIGGRVETRHTIRRLSESRLLHSEAARTHSAVQPTGPAGIGETG